MVTMMESARPVKADELLKQQVLDYCNKVGEAPPVTQEDYDKIIARMKAVGML